MLRRINKAQDCKKLLDDVDKLKGWFKRVATRVQHKHVQRFKAECWKGSNHKVPSGRKGATDIKENGCYQDVINIRTVFRNLTMESFRTFYITYVRPNLKYAAPK